MGNVSNIDGRWLYSKLRVCGHFRVIERNYNDWVRTNSSLTSFTCRATGEKNPDKLAKIQEFIDNHKLPVKIADLTWHNQNFVLIIIKPNNDDVPRSNC